MDRIYDAHAVRFRYPEDWLLSEAESDAEVSLTVSSPATSFWSLTLYFAQPDVEELIEAAVEAFRAEYEELDAYEVSGRLCERPAIGRDIEFVCLELLNTAYLRAFRTDRFTVLVLYQGTDSELEQTLPLMEDISNSLWCDPGGGIG